MGEGSQNISFWMGIPVRRISLVLLTIQYTAFILLLHYSRVMPVAGGRRYITSTAVFLNEVIKLAICLTVAMYEISKTVPPSMPATSLFTAVSAAVFSGDSWKLAIPAALYTLANSLQYIGISNLVAATFQVTYQLKLITTAVFGVALLRRSLPLGKWIALLLILAGVAIVQIPSANPSDLGSHRHIYFPRHLREWHDLGAAAGLTKRSATYEGIEEDMMLEHPGLNTPIGLLATIGACLASGLAGVSLEKVLQESASVTSVWIRNVQLAIYSIFPALFIGVVFVDGEKVARGGFFEGYNWIVWMAIGIQAIGGIVTSFCINRSEDALKNSATGISIVFSSLASLWFFEFNATGNFLLGTAIVLVATYIYCGDSNIAKSEVRLRPPPIRIYSYEKSDTKTTENAQSPPNDFSIKLPTTPLITEAAAITTSRPGSPSHHTRVNSSRGTYFGKQQRAH